MTMNKLEYTNMICQEVDEVFFTWEAIVGNRDDIERVSQNNEEVIFIDRDDVLSNPALEAWMADLQDKYLIRLQHNRYEIYVERTLIGFDPRPGQGFNNKPDRLLDFIEKATSSPIITPEDRPTPKPRPKSELPSVDEIKDRLQDRAELSAMRSKLLKMNNSLIKEKEELERRIEFNHEILELIERIEKGLGNKTPENNGI